MKKQISVVFRFDDYSSKSSTDIELKIIDAFRKNHAAVTFAVIPFICDNGVHSSDTIPLTSSKKDILRSAFNEGILDVALHGYSHQAINDRQATEFLGLDYNSQVGKLVKGKKFLEEAINAPINIFVPPWNTYDLNTLQILENLSFLTLSAGLDGKTIKESKLTFIPSSSDLSQLRDSVELARSYSKFEPVIVVLFHEYDFKEICEKRGIITYQEFSSLLHWLNSQDDVQVLSIGQAAKSINDLSVDRFLLNQRNNWLLSNLLHSYLQRKVSRSIYFQSPDVFLKTLFKIVSFYLAVIGLGGLISIMMWILVFPMSAFIMKTATFVSTVLLAVLLIYTLRKRQVRNIIFSAGAVGVSIGLWLSFLYSFS